MIMMVGKRSSSIEAFPAIINRWKELGRKIEDKRVKDFIELTPLKRNVAVMSGVMYFLGFICIILAPFTGITIVGAAAFFVIALIIYHS